MRRALLLLTLIGCPDPDAGALTYPCTDTVDCRPGRVCDPLRSICVDPGDVQVPMPDTGMPPPPPYERLSSSELRAAVMLPSRNTRYWYANGQTILRRSDPTTHQSSPDPAEALRYTSPAPLAAVVLQRDRLRAYYRDGTTGLGDDLAFDDERTPVQLPPGKVMDDVVAIASDGSETFAFFSDGTSSRGLGSDLSGNTRTTSVALAKGMTDVVATTFGPAGGLFTICHDGTVLLGDPSWLAQDGVFVGPLSGMAFARRDTMLFYMTGYVKTLRGTPAENWSETPDGFVYAGDWPGQRVMYRGYFPHLDGYTGRNAMGVSELETDLPGGGTSTKYGGRLQVYYDDGVRAFGEGQIVVDGSTIGFDLSGMGSYVAEDGYTFTDLIDVAETTTTSEEAMLSWFSRGVGTDQVRSRYWSRAEVLTLVSSRNAFRAGEGRSLDEVQGIGLAWGAYRGLWVLYADGDVARGWSQRICGFCMLPSQTCHECNNATICVPGTDDVRPCDDDRDF